MNEDNTLIAARCKRCYRLAAKYLDMKGGPRWARYARVKPGHPAAYYPCTCDPPPQLPQGEQLEKLLARAPLTIRV